MNKIILLAFAVVLSANAYCQRSNTNVLKLAVDKTKHFAVTTSNASIDIEGYDGDDLIIEATANKAIAPVPPEAVGLTKIPFAMRPGEDNTISYKQLEQNNTLNQISISTKCNYLHIKIPNNIKLFSVNSTSSRYGSYLTFINYKGAFELDGDAASVKVSKVSGPFNIKVRTESLLVKDVAWNSNAAWPVLDTAKSPLSAQSYPNISPYIIRSTKGLYSTIDIAFPAEFKASLFVISREGNVYSDLPLSGNVNITNTYRPILMNEGGSKIEIDGGNGDIYLRKQ